MFGSFEFVGNSDGVWCVWLLVTRGASSAAKWLKWLFEKKMKGPLIRWTGS